MKPNVGSADKVVRIFLGLVIVVIGFYYQSWWGLVGIVPVLTAFFGYCPAYSLIGVSTKNRVMTEKLDV